MVSLCRCLVLRTLPDLKGSEPKKPYLRWVQQKLWGGRRALMVLLDGTGQADGRPEGFRALAGCTARRRVPAHCLSRWVRPAGGLTPGRKRALLVAFIWSTHDPGPRAGEAGDGGTALPRIYNSDWPTRITQDIERPLPVRSFQEVG